MKYYILLILFVTHTVLCYSQNNTSTKWKDSIEAQIHIQQQRIDKYEATLEDKAKNIEEKLNMRNEYVDYKKEHVGWWLNTVGLLVAIFGVLIPAVGFFYGRKLYLDISNQKKIVDDEIFKLKGKTQEVEQIIKDAELCMQNLRGYDEKGKAILEYTESEVKKKLDHLDLLSKKLNLTEQEKNDAIEQANSISTEKDASPFEKELASAHSAFFSSDYKKAAELYADIIRKYTPNFSKEDFINIFFNLGHSEIENKNYDAGISHYTTCTMLDDSQSRAYHNIGIAYERKRDYDKAINSYLKAIEIEPSLSPTYTSLGTIYQVQQNLIKAKEYYYKAISLPQPSPVAHYNLAELLIFEGNIPEATRIINGINDPIQQNTVHTATNTFGIQFINFLIKIKTQPINEINTDLIVDEFVNLDINKVEVRWNFADLLKVINTTTFFDKEKHLILKLIDSLSKIFPNLEFKY